MNAYDAMERVDEGLYTVTGDFGRSPLRRRMTLVVLPSGGVVVHSAIRMSDADMAARVDALGPVNTLVVPNAFHTADAPFYAERYPQARALAPRSLRRKLAPRMRLDGSLEEDWPEDVNEHLACLIIGGGRARETAFLHRPTRTLILTDLCFNMGGHYNGLTRFLLTLNDSIGTFGPSRLFRWAFVKNWGDLLASVRQILEWDFDRVLVGHGTVVPSGGKELLRKAFTPYGL